MKKILIFILCLTLPTAQCLAMGGGGNAASNAAGNLVNQANTAGNDDTVQEAAGRAGEAIGNFGSNQYNAAWQHTNSTGNLTARAQNMANTGVKIAMTGKAVEYTAKAAPHVAWVSTSAGYASTGDYEGATLEAVNGGTRTVVVAHVATAAGVWAGGKVGALCGSWGGPLGAFAGFVVGCGAAYIGGKVWDAGIGKGKDALGQKISDWKAESRYGGTGGRGNQRANARNNARNATSTVRQTTRTTSRPSRSGCDGRGSCRRR